MPRRTPNTQRSPRRRSKTLVVDDKWFAALDAAIHGEMDRISQSPHHAREGTGRTLRNTYATGGLQGRQIGAESKQPPGKDGILMEEALANSNHVGKVATLRTWFRFEPDGKRKPGEVPIITSSGIGDSYTLNRKSLGPGVVTGRYGTIGEVFVYRIRCLAAEHHHFDVKDFHDNDPLFISYLLRTINFHSHSAKSGVPGVNRNTISMKYSVRLPHTQAEQEAIAETLSDADALIESLEQLIAKKRHFKQGAMQELLTGKKRLPGFNGRVEDQIAC